MSVYEISIYRERCWRRPIIKIEFSLSLSSFLLVGDSFLLKMVVADRVIGIYHADLRVNLNKEPLEESPLYSRSRERQRRRTKSTGEGMDHPDRITTECTEV